MRVSQRSLRVAVGARCSYTASNPQDDADLQSLPPPPVAVVNPDGDFPPLESFDGRSGGTFDGRQSDSVMSFGSDLMLRTSQPDDLDLLPVQEPGSLDELAMSGASDFDQALEMRLSGGNYGNPPAMAPPAPPSDVEPATVDTGAEAMRPPLPRKLVACSHVPDPCSARSRSLRVLCA